MQGSVRSVCFAHGGFKAWSTLFSEWSVELPWKKPSGNDPKTTEELREKKRNGQKPESDI